MRVIVLDASLAAAFLLREPSGGKFDAPLQGVVDGEVELWVPSLFLFELLNILVMAERRGRIPGDTAKNLMREWENLPVTVDAPPGFLSRHRIRELANTHGLTAYDAAYVELAERLESDLLTLDGDLLRLATAMPWIG